MTVTGCLEKGDDPNTYELTHVVNGTDWELVDAPATLKMSDDVGHKVEVSGTALAAGEKTADEKGISSGTGSGTAKMKDKGQERRMKVTSMKHVSATCPYFVLNGGGRQPRGFEVRRRCHPPAAVESSRDAAVSCFRIGHDRRSRRRAAGAKSQAAPTGL